MLKRLIREWCIFMLDECSFWQVGEQQARDLQARTATVDPQVLIVSPMRRAMQTGLLAFEPHVNGKREAPSSWTEGNKYVFLEDYNYFAPFCTDMKL
jgi:hypothetical protein